MSPVSRGRRKKNRSTSGPKARRAPARPAAPVDDVAGGSPVDVVARGSRDLPGMSAMRAQARHWWPASHAAVLDAARCLLDATTPQALEDAVCTLIGRHWQAMVEEQDRGFAEQEWLEALIDTAKSRSVEPAVRRLVYGIAAIAPPGLAAWAAEILRHTTTDGAEPAWLADVPTVTVSPDVQVLRDGYGLRFGLLTEVTGPGDVRRTYLHDVDLCHGHRLVLTSGYHPSPAAAAAAWRDLVGVSAGTAEPLPAPDDLLTQILPTGGVVDSMFVGPLTDSQFTELFRSDRIVSEIADALEAAGRPIVRDSDAVKRSDHLAAHLTERFRAWATAAGVDLPPPHGPEAQDDLVAWFLHDWVSPGMSEDTSLACSPHRIAAITAYLNDDWRPEHRTVALALFEPWARFCLEHSGVTGQAAEHTLAWARRAATEPDDVGGDLGNNLNLPIDETTLARPPLPAHAR